MKRFAVAKFSLHSNELEIRFTDAIDWKDALLTSGFYDKESFFDFETMDIETAKQEAFSMDEMFDVEEVL